MFPATEWDLIVSASREGSAEGGTALETLYRQYWYPVYRRHPGVNTWGAYQCYGDPEFRLATEDDGVAAEPAEEKFHAATEVCVRLQELEARAANAAAEDLERLSRRLDTLAEVALRDWADSAEVLAALGAASAGLGRFEQAVRCTQRALVCEDARLDLERVGQMCDHQTRWAVQCARQPKHQGQGTPAYRRGHRRHRAAASVRRDKQSAESAGERPQADGLDFHGPASQSGSVEDARLLCSGGADHPRRRQASEPALVCLRRSLTRNPRLASGG